MEDNLTIIKRQFENLKGTFVITESDKIERLVAISEDDMDYYYVTYNGREFSFNTCVGSVKQLIYKLDLEDYNSLVRSAKLNHWDQITMYGNKRPEDYGPLVESHKAVLISDAIKEGMTFLTEIAWYLVEDEK